MTKPLMLVIAALALAPAAVAADSTEARGTRIAAVFRPLATDRAALAPDGRHLAYELRRDERLFLVIAELETNEAVELPLLEDRPMPLSAVPEKIPHRLTYLGWATAQRLVATVQDELLIAVDADGRNLATLLDAPKLAAVTEEARRLAPEIAPSGELMAGYDVGAADFLSSNVRGQELARQRREELWERQLDPAAAFTALDEYGRPRPGVLSAHSDLGDPVQRNLFQASGPLGVVPTWRSYVADLLDDRPEEILVEVRGRAGPWDDGPVLGQPPLLHAHNITSALCRVNLRSGKITWSKAVNRTSRLWPDRAGRPRLVLEHFATERNYKVVARPGGRWQALDDLLKPAGFPASQVTPERFFGPRALPLGFGYEDSLLYVASNDARDTFGIYAVDLASGRRSDLAIEHPTLDLADFNEAMPGGGLVFDRHKRQLVGVRLEDVRPTTHWLDPELQALQRALEANAPGLDFRILEWDAERTRFLLRASNRSHPGAYYLYERAGSQLKEIVRRAPQLSPEDTSTSTPFRLQTADGRVLRGYFTYPGRTRIEPVPVLIYCHDGPWSRDGSEYDAGAQALALMGFAVLQVNYRGSSGYGRAHLEALRKAGERVAVEDLLAALDWVQQTHAISRRRVAILGHGYGGYLALRATQLHPDRFRCAVGINAPADLPRWMNYPHQSIAFRRDVRAAFFRDAGDLQAASLTSAPEAFRRPLLLIHADGDTVVPESQTRAFRRALAGATDVPVEVLRLPAEGHSGWLPGTSVRVFERLEAFFRENIFEFVVETGEAQPVDP